MADDHIAHDWKADARAAFMGLIFGALALLAIMYAIVQYTNRKFEGHSAGTPPAAGTPVQH
jgi:hypothetical protein